MQHSECRQESLRKNGVTAQAISDLFLRNAQCLNSEFCILNYELIMGLQAYLTLAAVVFGIGLFGVITRRNTIGILLGIELMLNAVNINLVAFSRFHGGDAGMVFTLFAICITVAEVALGLAIVILLFRLRRTASADHVDWLKG
jgi:NADH-quinone oxidoreductase subunit K